jgi:hypothetical protein
MLLKRKPAGTAPAKIVRIFRCGAEQYLDPDPSKSVEECVALLAEKHAHLTNCAIETTEEGSKHVHTLKEKTGARGGGAVAKQTVNLVPSQGKRG